MDLASVKSHYAAKLEQFGASAQGVDWKDDDAQLDRLRALCLLFGNKVGFSVNDWGCGYGHLAYLVSTDDYTGYDIVPQDLQLGAFVLADAPQRIADYTVASGLFNVMAGADFSDWQIYVINCIKKMDECSRVGYGFNMLHTRADKKQDGLFYSSPGWVMAHLPPHERVSILQTYSPYDFTILVNR